jgi:anaerobic ribonucleoside-triphosphate reductase activating protein
MKVKLAGIQHNSVVDGPGLRTVIFAQGCPHCCPGCHNPQTQNPESGTWVDVVELAAEISANRGVRGVTFSGGEPFMQPWPLVQLAAILKQSGYNLAIYTGYTYEELKDRAAVDPATAALLTATDLLIDGRFLREERDLSLIYRGSRNQRVIDIPATLKTGSVVLSPLHSRGQEQAYA